MGTAEQFLGLSARERNAIAAEVMSARAFRLIYEDDPVAFAYDCFTWPEGQGLTHYQEEVLAALADKGRVAVRGPHGLGKTAMASVALLWFALTRDGDDWKAITTASVWRQLTQFLWPEVHKWSRRLRWETLGREPFDPRVELQKLHLVLSTGEAFAVASDDHTAIEGAHADRLLYIFDESKAIKDETFDAAEGAFSGAGAQPGMEAFAFAISTPGTPAGRFYDIHARKKGFEKWWTRHVTLKEAIKAKRIDVGWAMDRERQWGAESPVFANRVLGEFAADDEAGIIPLAWVEAAIERWRHWDGSGRKTTEFTGIGVDVADGGEDDTVFAFRFGPVISEIRRWEKGDTMATAGRVAAAMRKHPRKGKAVVDSIGVGAGVVARLKELKVRVSPFNAAERATGKDRSGEMEFSNKRSQAWWSMREMLDPQYGEDIMLPPDDAMVGDLVTPRYRILSGGKLQVESKDDIRRRLGRSTDAGDAVVMAFYSGGRGAKLRAFKA